MDVKLTIAVAIGIALTLVADMTLKANRLLLGMVLYAAVAIPALFALRSRNFGTTLVIWEMSYFVLFIAFSYAWYKEPLSGRHLLALIFAIAAILLDAK